MRMAASELPDSGKETGGKDAQAQVRTGSSWTYFAELSLVFGFAYLLFALQSFCLAPKLSLLFDSQGYIFTTQSCFAVFNPENLSRLSQYICGGCQNEFLRQAIVNQIPGIYELVKSGPVLPGILLCVYALLGKSLTLSHWQLAASAMIALSAVTVCGIWAWARELGGTATARLAFLLAVTYSGFAVNSGRILTEIPATTLSILALFSVYLCAKSQARRSQLARQPLLEQGDEPSGKRGKRAAHTASPAAARRCFLEVLLSGFLTGLLMLARPTLLPWPLLMAFSLFLYSFFSGKRQDRYRVISTSTILAFVLGCSIAIAPWALCKKVLSGVPSISVERYGPLNLSRGMDLRTDGYDSLPSAWVAHPEKFQQSFGQVLHELSKQFAERPAAMIHMLLRKPARLLDSPWNDFQTQSLGLPFLLQRFLHQFILICGLLGAVLLLEHGRKRPDYLLLLGGLLISLFLVFHLVTCAFITMSRYFITAMPVAIVAAAYFLTETCRQGKRFKQAICGVLAAPTVSFVSYYMLLPGYGRLSDLSSDIGLAPMSLTAAFFMTAALATSILLPTFTVFRGARSKILLSTVTLCCGFSCLLTVCYQFMCSEAVVRLGVTNHKKLISQINIPPGTNYSNWYLVIDGNDAPSLDLPEPAEGILSDIKLGLNGRELKTDWLPLLLQDQSMREEQLFLSAFAYSARKRCRDFRQWRCTALPAESIVSPGQNTITFALSDGEKTHPKIFADFSDQLGKRIHTVSLREFSWTKGFFSGTPGEMRMDEWPDNSDRRLDVFNLCGQASKLKPRIFLLGVNQRTHSDSWARSAALPDQHIGEGRDELMARIEINPVPGLADYTPGQSLRLRVSGRMRAEARPVKASICLLECFKQANKSFDEYAPLAPQTFSVPADSWRNFAFEDIINPQHPGNSAEASLSNNTLQLQSLKLQFFHTPWWEALGYGAFKGKGRVEFKDLKLEVFGQASLDLEKSKCQWFELDSQFDTSQ